MEELSFKLDGFEGPLDLLLHLIQKNKLNIQDIPVLTLVDQYIEYINEAQQEDLDIASEFLEMAARLIHIKTVSLLPRQREAEELKSELTGELLEYQQCKEAAERLAQRFDDFSTFAREPQVIKADNTYAGYHQPYELTQAYIAAVGRGKRRLPPPITPFRAIVARKIVAVSTKIVSVLRSLRKSGTVKYNELLFESTSRSELVATFLALLELVKSGRIQINGTRDEQVVTLKEGAARQ